MSKKILIVIVFTQLIIILYLKAVSVNLNKEKDRLRNKDFLDVKYYEIHKTRCRIVENVNVCGYHVQLSNTEQISKQNPHLYKQFIYCMIQKSIEDNSIEKGIFRFYLHDSHYKLNSPFHFFDLVISLEEDYIFRNSFRKEKKEIQYDNLAITKEDWELFNYEDCDCKFKSQGSFMKMGWRELNDHLYWGEINLDDQ